MTPRLSERCSLRGDDRGGIMVMALFVLIALFAVVGLAVDAGNLYRARTWLQKAADAGALAGIGYAIYQGDARLATEAGSAANVKSLIEAKAKNVAEQNLRLVGMAPGIDEGNRLARDIVITPEYTPAGAGNLNDVLSVRVSARINFLLMHMVPLQMFGVEATGRNSTVAADASSQRKVANVMLVVDSSDSMGCPATGSCDCLGPNRSGPCAAPLKVDKLKEAVSAFLDHFDPTRDRVALTTYNIAARVNVPVNTAGGFDRAVFDAALDGLLPVSSTNIADGLIRGYLDMKRLGDDASKTYVLFSDGAPTATRVLLNSARNLPNWDPDTIGSYDYTHYTLQWVDVGASWPGPSLLVQTGLLPENYSSAAPPPGSNPGPAPCSGTSAPFDAASFPAVFSDCVNDLSFHMPGKAGTSYGGNTPTFNDWRQVYYNNAIQLTDFLREEKGLVFSIGLGTPAGVLPGDPYQTIDDNASRKDIFGARAANDYLEGVVEAEDDIGSPYPEYAYANYRTYEQWNSQPDPKHGDYLSTLDASGKNLETLFRKVAVKIKLTLIQ